MIKNLCLALLFAGAIALHAAESKNKQKIHDSVPDYPAHKIVELKYPKYKASSGLLLSCLSHTIGEHDAMQESIHLFYDQTTKCAMRKIELILYIGSYHARHEHTMPLKKRTKLFDKHSYPVKKEIKASFEKTEDLNIIRERLALLMLKSIRDGIAYSQDAILASGTPGAHFTLARALKHQSKLSHKINRNGDITQISDAERSQIVQTARNHYAIAYAKARQALQKISNPDIELYREDALLRGCLNNMKEEHKDFAACIGLTDTDLLDAIVDTQYIWNSYTYPDAQ